MNPVAGRRPDPKNKTNDNKLLKNKMFLCYLQVKRECQEVVKREGIDKLTIEDLVQVTTVPEFIDPVFTKTSPKGSFSIIKNERFVCACLCENWVYKFGHRKLFIADTFEVMFKKNHQQK
jgi:hypothetical protein